MRTVFADLTFGVRLLRRNPGFTLAALVSLALGIGVNCTVFTGFDAVLLKQLRVRDADRLVVVTSEPSYQIGASSGPSHNSYSYPSYLLLRQHAAELPVNLACRGARNLVLSHRGVGEKVRGEFVSTDFFDVIGVGSGAGRLFGSDDARNAREAPVAVLSHAYWQKRFGGDPSAIGAEVTLNGHPVTVVGVAEPGFDGVEWGRPPAVYVPVELAPVMYSPGGSLILERPRVIWLQLLGRLGDGASRQEMQAALDPRFRSILEREVEEMDASVPMERKERYLRQHLSLKPGHQGVDNWRRAAQPPMILLMGVVGVVFLIACVNVANLLLARAVARRREAAVRQTLGAGPARLFRQYLVESLLLALSGGALGLLFGEWGLAILREVLPGSIAAMTPDMDGRVVVFTTVISAAACLLFGTLPALQLARMQPITALKSGGATETGRRVGLGHVLVAVQVGLSVLLLATAGLFLRTLLNLYSVEPGFETKKLLVVSLDPPRSGYTEEQTSSLRRDLLERVRALPGVEAAAIAAEPVLSRNPGGAVIWNVEGYDSDVEGTMSSIDQIGPGFLSTIGVPLLAGRECTVRDTKDTPWVAIVNQSFARHYTAGANPVGKRFGFGEKGAPWHYEIVGLVPDAAFRSVQAVNDRMVFTCYEQHAYDSFTIHVRTAGDPASLLAAIRSEVRRLDAGMPILDLKTVAVSMSENLEQERALAIVTTALACLALLLAGAGLYGVISYTVARRTREIGIRVAVGATQWVILGQVLRESFWMVTAGVVGGSIASLAGAQLTRGFLFGVEPQDPATLLFAGAISFALGLLATWVPARRAMAVDPTQALRHE